MPDLPLELVCDSCGYACCAEGKQLCEDALNGIASFCTRDEWERRRVEGDPFVAVEEAA